MLEFDYEKIMKSNVVVHCDEECKAKNLLKWADSNGLKWGGGDIYTLTKWTTYETLTAYNLYKGCFG